MQSSIINNKMLILGLTSVTGPYIRARWSAFSNKYPQNKVLLIEFGKFSKIYDWLPLDIEVPYQRTILFEQATETLPLYRLIFHLVKELNRNKPNIVVLNGYAMPATLSALVWSICYGKPAILLSDSKEDDAPRSWWSENFKRLLLKGYKTALVAGKPQKRYLTKLGMNPESIFTGYDVVGNDDFHPNKIKSLPNPHQKPYFLAINRFVPKKNLPTLISSYGRYRQIAGTNSWDLVLCGDGELRPQIEEQIARFGLQDFVLLPGFLQQNQLLPYFAHASCFIHASIQEQWGLVVNEAMAAGLPVIVSNRCGCFEDLVVEGANGFGFDPTNSQQLTQLMLKISSGEIDLKRMSQASLEHIDKFSPDYFARGLMQAVEYALVR